MTGDPTSGPISGAYYLTRIYLHILTVSRSFLRARKPRLLFAFL
jgi:hypothetical protein